MVVEKASEDKDEECLFMDNKNLITYVEYFVKLGDFFIWFCLWSNSYLGSSQTSIWDTFWYSVFLCPILDSPLPCPDVTDPDAADGDDDQDRDHEDGDQDGDDHMGRVGWNECTK